MLRRDDHRNGIRRPVPPELHRGNRSGWLRAAVLGANGGLVSTASLVVGMAAAGSTPTVVMLTGVAGLVAGAMSMAAGEYVSVHAQAETERADLRQEQAALRARPAAELKELAATFVARGVDETLANAVAVELTAHDALAAHAKEELGLSGQARAWPLQAALSSAASFAVGAALPLLVLSAAPPKHLLPLVVASTLAGLAVLGSAAAEAGGTRRLPAALRVAFWGALAMSVTSVVGAWFGAAT
jgi:VIT1/CCC1 family predicted Fe2+/Mn2+ transporter